MNPEVKKKLCSIVSFGPCTKIFTQDLFLSANRGGGGSKIPQNMLIKYVLTPSPRVTRFPLARIPLTRILAYVRASGGFSR